MNGLHTHNSEKKRRKPRPEAWPLRPGDLPEPRVVSAEPRLAGMADNAVFRLAMFRRRGKVDVSISANRTSVLIVLAIWLGLNYLAIQLLPFPWLTWVSGTLNALGAGVWTWRANRASAGRLAHDFGLTPRDYEDLRSAGVDTETAVAGLWGAAVSYRRWRRARWVCLGLAAGLLALGLLPAVVNPVPIRIAWYIALYCSVMWHVRLGGVPWVQLGALCARLRSAAAHPPTKIFPGGAIHTLILAVMSAFAISWMIFASPAWWAMALFGGGSGLLLGWLSGRFIAREARLAASLWHRDAVRYMDALFHPLEYGPPGRTRELVVPAPVTDPMLDPAPPPLPRR